MPAEQGCGANGKGGKKEGLETGQQQSLSLAGQTGHLVKVGQ